MRARSVLAAALAASVLTAAAPAQAAAVTSPASLAKGLAADPVYVVPGARPTLTPAQAGVLRLRILDRDIGRIHFAVVPGAVAQRAGGVGPLANAIDRRLRAKGSLVVVAGSSIFVVVSYPRADEAANALRAAVAKHPNGPLDAQLLAGIDRLARVDPGPAGDVAPAGMPAVPGTPGIPDFSGPVHAVTDTIRLVILIVGLAFALPFLIVAYLIVRRVVRRRRDDASAFATSLQDARAQLVALGEDIGSLDIDTSLLGADAAGVKSYGEAVDLYQRAETALDQASDMARLRAAQEILGRAKQCMEVAHTRLDATPAATSSAGPASSSDDARKAAERALGRP